MSSWELSPKTVREPSLSPPSYSVQEDPSSGDLLSRSQQLWPDRPEFGRYSLEFQYMDQRRIDSLREKRAKKRRQIVKSEVFEGRAKAGGGSSRTAMMAASDIIMPFHSNTATKVSSDELVRTSMLFSSTSALGQGANRSTTTDDLLTLGGIPPAKSPSLVPSELLRSSCSSLQNESDAHALTAIPYFQDQETATDMTSAYHFMGGATDQEAAAALRLYPFVVYLKKGSNCKRVKVGFHTGREPRLFPVEILNIEEGGTLWRVTGTTYSIGFRTLEDMACFYRRFPSTAE